jgi:raffinose/stachyose/melibiose transport system permease protein
VAVTGLKREQRKYIALLLTPAILTILVFTTVPAVTTLSYAFFKWEGFQRGGFAGLANFQRYFD